MKKYLLLGFISLVSLSAFCNKETKTPVPADGISIPLGGNAWFAKKVAYSRNNLNSTERITQNGLENWGKTSSAVFVYFRIGKPDDAYMYLRLKTKGGNATVKVIIEGKSFLVTSANTLPDTIKAGKIHFKDTGYVKLELQNISETGNTRTDISDIILTGEQVTSSLLFVKDNKSNNFYWGRRGPSVHLNYNIPVEVREKVEWFYNEVTVPVGEDAIGSYFMANGFNSGYFGMQVNSATERRVLFSIWSPFATDDPKSIPDSLQIKLLRKGKGVKTGEFGNEGSGGQSYLIYPWVASKTYIFLTNAEPDPATNHTVYTSYFKDPDANQWMLIASFKRPSTNSYLKGLYSFLENFNTETGNIERKGEFGNQWARSTEGKWYEITTATFTGDAIAKLNYRKDFAGGSNGKTFYLKNCGFFNQFVPLKTPVSRASTGRGYPIINIKSLP